MIQYDVIYLQDGDDPKLYAEIEVTWCSDRVNDDDTKYVKADLLAECEKQRDKLRDALESDDYIRVLEAEIAEQADALKKIISMSDRHEYGRSTTENCLLNMAKIAQATLDSVQDDKAEK